MKLIVRIIERITHVMHTLGGVFLIAMMIVTLADVITRGVFTLTGGTVDLTFIGGIEMVQYSLLFTVLFILPHSVSRSQVIVDLFTERLDPRTKQALEGMYLFCFGLIGMGMSYSFYHHFGEAAATYETTLDLMIPLTYFYAVACFATIILAISAAMHSFQLIICGKAKS